jgi:hypothetical protein
LAARCLLRLRTKSRRELNDRRHRRTLTIEQVRCSAKRAHMPASMMNSRSESCPYSINCYNAHLIWLTGFVHDIHLDLYLIQIESHHLGIFLGKGITLNLNGYPDLLLVKK